MKLTRKNILGYIAVAIVCTMIGATLTLVGSQGGAAQAEAPQSATVVTSPFTAAVQQVIGSVVGVNNYQTYTSRNYNYGFGYGFGYDSRGRDSESESRQVLAGSGSGVVVGEGGYVLTNYHVVDGATMLEVEANDKTYPATLVASDSALDIAVVKAEGLNLPAVKLGDSDSLLVGDWAICIGNPISFTSTTTVGIISALNREITTDTTYDRYGRRTEVKNVMIQTDAAINSGNSGGGLFSTAGELMGIPSIKYTGSYYSSASVDGIGMAIPINSAKELIAQALSGKTTSASASDASGATASGDSAISAQPKPRIGVSVSNMNQSNTAVATGILPNGAYVSAVEAGSPAEIAGIQVGDIVVEVDGEIITSTTQMVNLLTAKNAGDTVAIRVYRVEGLPTITDYTAIPEGAYVDVTVTLAILDNIKQ